MNLEHKEGSEVSPEQKEEDDLREILELFELRFPPAD